MSAFFAALVLAALAAPPTARRAPLPASTLATADRKSAEIEVVVVGNLEDNAPGGTNVLEMGHVSYSPRAQRDGRPSGRRSARVTILRRMVTVRIGRGRTGFAPLRAALSSNDGRSRIRVDGKTLTAVAQVIDPLAPLGQAVSHVVEIEIPASVAEGPISASIAWTSDPQ